MGIKSSQLSWIVVSDLAQAKHFFHNILGLEMSMCSEEHGWAELNAEDGGATLGLAMASEYCPVQSGGNAVMTFTVDNLEEMKGNLQGKGVDFIGEIVEVPGHVKLQTFLDPDGNVFQLVEQLS